MLILLQAKSGGTPWYHMFVAIRNFAETNLFIINNQGMSLNPTGAALPLIFKAGGSFHQLSLPLEQFTVIQSNEYMLAEQSIQAINTVLCKIVPDMKLALMPLGNGFTENGKLRVRVQLVRNTLESGTNESIQLPLKYESNGIKKIISLLSLFICAYNNPSMTLAVDSLDSDIYEYLLGELLRIMQDSGLGQLIFTSHNLRPLEVLPSNSVIFATTNPQGRYIRASRVKSSNNLRLRYLRDITLGSDADELCQEISSIEIAHAMRKAGAFPMRHEKENSVQNHAK